MNKSDFALKLYEKLPLLPSEEIDERLSFYFEMIDDRIDEGLTEEEAVSEIGSVDDIAQQIIADIPLSVIVKKKVKSKRRLKVSEIILLVLGSPIWLSLIIAIFAIILSLYISLWAVIISLWVVFASLVACSLGSVVACAVFATGGNATSGVVVLAAGFVCAGLAIFMFYGCKAATKGILILTKKMAMWLKNCFIKKEVA